MVPGQCDSGALQPLSPLGKHIACGSDDDGCGAMMLVVVRTAFKHKQPKAGSQPLSKAAAAHVFRVLVYSKPPDVLPAKGLAVAEPAAGFRASAKHPPRGRLTCGR